MASSKSSKGSGNKNLKIGPWVLGSFLGQGYAAQVREATHEKSGQKAAIKILTKDDNNEKAELLKKMREKEIIIMKLVDHPNIVRLYDVYETANHIYLVMELLQGSLFSYVVKSVRVSPNKALVFFQQIIEALDYMHKHLICHRDLKPENFLLNSHSGLKVCDFGFASLMKGDDDMLNTRCGTLHYASPDILTEGDGYDGRLHDVWSAGVNLYVMVTGELPFNDKNPKILLRKIMTGTFEFPPQVPLPYDLKDLIFRMLTVDAKQRITIPEIKKHPWYCSKPYNIPPDVCAHMNPEESFDDIDDQILNAIVLLGVGWDNIEEFRAQLKKKGMNAEKVVYLLLLRKKLNPSKEDYSFSYAEKVQRAAASPSGGAPSSGSAITATAPVEPTTNGSTSDKGSASSSHSSTANESSPAPVTPSPAIPGLKLSPRERENSMAEAKPPNSARMTSREAKEEKKKKRHTKQFDETPEEISGKNTARRKPGTVPEQNQTVNSIDKILSWFNKPDKKKGKEVSTPIKAEGPSQLQEEEDGEGEEFFDLLMRSNEKPVPKKGDLRIRQDKRNGVGGGEASATPTGTSPSTKSTSAERSIQSPAQIPPPQIETPASVPVNQVANNPPQPDKPAPAPPVQSSSPVVARNKTETEVGMSVFITFVPNDLLLEFENKQKSDQRIVTNKCSLVFKDSSGASKPVCSVAEYNHALASGFLIECVPSPSPPLN
eukprot:TRINITY_DN200_c0_g2_i1.p1 TRINITY_DN200_c0_g2~~TRINITY_DN200_c0_g2_i1.p1  ORF type:complete len:716 (-),score=183.18 TRINITY_DN200_c0_g2_i1:116-2263(-)